jgi:diguanylate cyclase (GGDEF)-like protein
MALELRLTFRNAGVGALFQMTDVSISLAEVDASFARVDVLSPFDAKVEARYRRDIQMFRRHDAKRGMIPAIVSYNLLLLTDLALLPETAMISAILHIFVVSPALVGLFLLIRRTDSYLVSQVLTASIPVLIVTQTLYILSLNEGVNAGHYQYFISLIILFSIINQRLDLKVTLGNTGLLIVLYAVTVIRHPLPIDGKVSGLVFTLVSSYLALLVSINFLKDSRYAYLMRLREEVRFKLAESEALHDPLTGLHNRRYVQEFARHLQDQPTLEKPLSVILLDIDFFKRYNDFHGHGQGDSCLRRVARAIDRAVIPDEGVSVRYGGEEFLVLLQGIDGEQAAVCAERIRACVEAEAIVHGRSDASEVVTVSLGVSTGRPTAETFGALVSSADEALYVAKAEGRNCVCTAWEIGKRS